ncbi:MAG: monophosphatase [Pseudonocardiales bacterium]|nr:monophosphatase [Pseudonocardiales bacterium]
MLRAVAEQVVVEAVEHLRTLPRPWDRTWAQSDGDGHGGSSAGSGVAGVAGVSTKSTPTDVVTAADIAIEALVRERLAHLRPGEPVVGEERGGAAEPGVVTWVVDPIDGTVNFLYGLPWYAVSLAATRDGVSLAGVVAEPAAGRLWSAAAGGGATCDGRPLHASAVTELDMTLVGTGFAYSAERRTRQGAFVAGLLPRVRDLRRTGSSALDVCAVAAGWLDAYVEHGPNWWDWAASALIAREAGAVVRTPPLPGRDAPDDGLGPDVLVAAAPGVAVELAALARELGAASV